MKSMANIFSCHKAIPRQVKTRGGLSLVELIVTITILAILAAGIVPLSRNAAIRTKEIELRRNLRTIRTAIDNYRKYYDKIPAGPLKSLTDTGYPKSLKDLVEGHDFKDGKGAQKFLRRIPRDPFNPYAGNEEAEMWQLRSSIDKPDSTIWGKEDVFDVSSYSEGVSLDGRSKYNEW